MDFAFQVLDSSLFQWNLDSRFHSLVGYSSSIVDYKALDSGFHIKIFPDSGSYKQKFPVSGIRIPFHGAKYKSNIF